MEVKHLKPIRGFLGILLMALCIALCPIPAAAGGEQNSEQEEWTVLIYLCGSDLESRYGYATENLQEITKIHLPGPDYLNSIGYEGHGMNAWDQVNVLFVTGGSKEWHTQKLGMDVKTDCLQYWRFVPDITDENENCFILEKETALSSMADPRTLSVFIQWGTQAYPAKKYALVLWDHGGGSKTGIFADELFMDGVMYLDALQEAVSDGGVDFELVLFDACMMANLETAWAVRDHAAWMVASEEMVAGRGTAIGDWLQQLYYLPYCDGRSLGRWICDMTQIKYANENEKQIRELITWSVINLSKIEELAIGFDRLFENLGEMYLHDPLMLSNYCKSMFSVEEYGNGRDNMFDLAGIAFQPLFQLTAPIDLRLNLETILAETVVYSVRGSGRSAARGLSFCFATDFDADELDVYAHNCPSPHYLACLDAISPWNAPESVYEKVERLPELSTMEQYLIHINKFYHTDGTPAFYVEQGDEVNVGSVFYNLYWKNEKTGKTVCLGTAPAYFDKKSMDRGFYRVYDLWLWPSIGGELCQIIMLNYPQEGNYDTLFNIPVRINSEIWNLRCGYRSSRDAYELYGLWEGYDADSESFNRNVKSLSQMAGQEFQLVYAVDTENRNAQVYEASKGQTMYRSMDVEEMVLPVGTYYLEFVISDFFLRTLKLERVEIEWDGEAISVPEQSWEGQKILNPMSYYDEE